VNALAPRVRCVHSFFVRNWSVQDLFFRSLSAIPPAGLLLARRHNRSTLLRELRLFHPDDLPPPDARFPRRTLPDASDSLPILDRLANRLTKIAAELRKLDPK
jgi:hypothetical protein